MARFTGKVALIPGGATLWATARTDCRADRGPACRGSARPTARVVPPAPIALQGRPARSFASSARLRGTPQR